MKVKNLQPKYLIQVSMANFNGIEQLHKHSLRLIQLWHFLVIHLSLIYAILFIHPTPSHSLLAMTKFGSSLWDWDFMGYYADQLFKLQDW